jgi:uncharacterized protein (TIGR02246 family)
MSSLLPTLLLIAVVAPSTTAPASAPATSPPPVVAPVPANDEAVHQALRQLKATMSKALNERDLETIVANVTPDVVFTTMNGDVCKGKDAIRTYFDKMLNGPGHVVKDVKVAFEADALTTLYGGDVGIAYGSSSDHYELVGGQTFDIQGRWSCTMVREGDRWLIASFHYSANVFDNPILAKVRKLGFGMAMVLLPLGLLVGFVVGKRSGGKRAAV